MSDDNDNHVVKPACGLLRVTTYPVGVMHRSRKPNKRNYDVEEKRGTSLSVALDKPVIYHRVIDKTNDRYFEKIVDPDTGDVVRDVSEKLSDHQGRGHAKRASPLPISLRRHKNSQN